MSPLRTFAVLIALLAACSSDSTGSANLLTVKGVAGPPPPAPPAPTARLAASPPVGVADPSTFFVGLNALYISPNADCSSPILVQDYGSTTHNVDMITSPTLFSSATTPGTYPCVAIDLSDVLVATTDTAFGHCPALTAIYNDTYKAGETDWKDIALTPIIGHGDDTLPAGDRVTILITTDTAAAVARGFSSNQVLPLLSSLVVPGTATMYWDGRGTVQDDGVKCNLEPPLVSFR